MSTPLTFPCFQTAEPKASGGVQAFWRLSRPATLLAPALGITSGAVAGLAACGLPADSAWIWNLTLGALSFTALNAGSNALNQYCDRLGDAIDKPCRPLPSGRLTEPAVLGFAAAGYSLAVLLATFVAPPKGGWAFLALFAVATIATVVYSVPPLRTKRWWQLALPTIALARGLVLFTAGWSVVAPLSFLDPWLIGGILALFLLGAAATKDWADRRGDAATGCRTLPLEYGSRGAALRVAPFFVCPWLLLFGAAVGTSLHANRVILAFASLGLCGWGVVAARSLLTTDPDNLRAGRNHPAWGHMYAMLALAHVGVAASYVLNR